MYQIAKTNSSMRVSSQELREMQIIMLDILLCVIRAIEEMGLQYYLSAGTALGAVRHHGFVPWDDDVDIMMPREDRNIFLSKCQDHLPDNLEVHHYKTSSQGITEEDIKRHAVNGVIIAQVEDKRFWVTRKMWGLDVRQHIWVDIAVLDEVPDNKLSYWVYRSRLTILHNLLKIHRLEYKAENHKSHKAIADVALAMNRRLHFARFIDPMAVVARIDRILESHDGKGYSRLINYAGEYKFKEVVSRETMGSGKLEQFEGHLMKVPSQCDEYLRSIYGDYMRLPPESERVCKHVVAFERAD